VTFICADLLSELVDGDKLLSDGNKSLIENVETSKMHVSQVIYIYVTYLSFYLIFETFVYLRFYVCITDSKLFENN